MKGKYYTSSKVGILSVVQPGRKAADPQNEEDHERKRGLAQQRFVIWAICQVFELNLTRSSPTRHQNIYTWC